MANGIAKKLEEYLARQRALGYDPSLDGVDEEDLDYVPSWSSQNPEKPKPQPLSQTYWPVDREFAERMFKLFAKPSNPKWKMPDLDGPEYRQLALNADADGQGADKVDDPKVWVDPLGMFPQYEFGQGSSGTVGSGTYDHYRNSEIVTGAGRPSDSDQTGNMMPSDKAASLIENHEGLRTNIYRATPNDPPTIGIGHKILPGEDFSGGITEEQAREIFKKDLEKNAVIVDNWTKENGIKLTQQQFDALVSFTFNIGSIGVKNKTQIIADTIKTAMQRLMKFGRLLACMSTAKMVRCRDW